MVQSCLQHFAISSTTISSFPFFGSTTLRRTVLTMRRSSPVFFFLAPESPLAHEIVYFTGNASFKHKTPDKTVGLRIGLDHIPKTPGALVSFGIDRSSCDIILPQGFALRQCLFFIHPHTGEVLLRDTTRNASTALITATGGQLNLPNIEPRQRVVLTTESIQYVQMGATVRFRLIWGKPKEAFRSAKTKPELLPRWAVDRPQPRICEDGKIVHKILKNIGVGYSATVFSTVDLNTGDHLAVKVYFRFDSEEKETKTKNNVLKEVELVSKLSHVRYKIFWHHGGFFPC